MEGMGWPGMAGSMWLMRSVYATELLSNQHRERQRVNMSMKKLSERLESAVHLVIDWETQDLAATAEVLSLGVAIVRIGEQYSGAHVVGRDWWHIQPQFPARTRSPETVAWWQEKERREQWNDMQENRMPIQEVIEEFMELVDRLEETGQDCWLWGYGADFDLAILSNVLWQYGSSGRKLKYRNFRCLRTLCAMYPDVQHPSFDELHITPHTAQDDAEYEAHRFCAIYGYIKQQEQEQAQEGGRIKHE
jgi:hypothetical protein